MIDMTHAKPEQHHCPLPPIRTWDDTAEDVYATVRHLPIDTRFTCPHCRVVYVVTHVPEQVSRTAVMTARREWRIETRRQRRERLGLRWWQR